MSVVSLRLPETLHRDLRDLARREGVSLNQLIVLAAGEKAAVLRRDEEYLRSRAARGSRATFEAALAQVLDAPPMPGDEWPEVK